MLELLVIQQKMTQLKHHLQGQLRHYLGLHYAWQLLILVQVGDFFALHLLVDFLFLLLLSFHLVFCFFFPHLQQLTSFSYEICPFLIQVFFTKLKPLFVVDQGHFGIDLHLPEELLLPRPRPHYRILLPNQQLQVGVPTLLWQFLAAKLQNWLYFSCLQAR